MGPELVVNRLKWTTWPSLPPAGSGPAQFVPLKGLRGREATLAAATIILAGLGAVGGRCLAELKRAGVGHLYAVDPDTYGPDSWLTQPIPSTGHAGLSKAVVQGQIASLANPFGLLAMAIGYAQDLPLWLLAKASALVIAGDNHELAVWAAERGAALGKPVIQGAVDGESWLAVCRGYDLADPESVCPACGLSDTQWRGLRSRMGCDPQTMRSQGLEPTRTLPNVCGIAAMMTASEVLKTVLGDEQRLCGEEAAYCLLSQKIFRSRFTRNPACRCPHASWTVLHEPSSPAQVTLRMLARCLPDALPPDAMEPDAALPVQVRGDIASWCSHTLCTGCGRHPAVMRFARPGGGLGTCACGRPLAAWPLGISSILPASDLCRCADRPLSELGILPGDALGISRGTGRWCYFVIGNAASSETDNDLDNFLGATRHD